MVGSDGALPLPWLEAPLAQAQHARQAHALLVHGPAGIGQWELALTLAQAWLCEAAEGTRHPCGRCASCHLVQTHTHPDLLVLLPEALREPLGWASDDGDGEGASDKASKAKPSKDIKVVAVRAAVAFAQTTTARGRAKVVVMHPAERMNDISANTLLKTLEEPPGQARFVLSCASPEALLPTIRSRCQTLVLGLPDTAQALAWLAGRGVAQPEVLLNAAGGQPLDALEWLALGASAELWARLPALLARGDGSALSGWPLPRVIEALQKLCHDAMCLAVGAAPRYFPADAITGGAPMGALVAWSRALQRHARHAEHPWHAALMLESLVQQAAQALAPRRAQPAPRGVSLHSKP